MKMKMVNHEEGKKGFLFVVYQIGWFFIFRKSKTAVQIKPKIGNNGYQNLKIYHVWCEY